MKFHKEEYERLLLKFALELSEVGVTEDMLKKIASTLDRSPNVIQTNASEQINRFTYRYSGYVIEAKQTVELVIKTCK